MHPIKPKPTNRRARIIVTVICSLMLLGGGLFTMQILSGFSESPPEKIVSENPLLVKTIVVTFEDINASITGYGEIKAIKTLPVSAEITGTVDQIHPRLEIGEIISRQDLLIKIDVREDEILLASSIQRLSLLKRNLELSANDFQRLKTLYHDYHSGTLSDLEQAERALNSATDTLHQLEFAIASTRLNIQKSEIRAPFTGRLKEVSIEKGQTVTPGSPILTLVDDSMLEVHVPVDSEKARQLIRFKVDSDSEKDFWFSSLEPLPSRITWSQDQTEISFLGVLHRVVDFDAKTRTVILAVRLEPRFQTSSQSHGFPLVEGMFCKVEIPGKLLKHVVKLPRQAVTYDHTVRVVKDNRLKTVPVTLGSVDERFAYITSGIAPDQEIIITPLVNPLENILVQTSTDPMTAQHARR